jgi:osmotically inducible lipoprotein OsmB
MRLDLRRAAIVLGVASLPVLVGGCSHGSTRGGLIGGAGGAVVGSATGLGTTEGALIGGTAGAVIGDDKKK